MVSTALKIVFGISIALTAIAIGASTAQAVEKPDYKVILEDEKFEIREYPAMIVAEVTVSGGRKEAGNKSFKKLADFIFGNNQSQSKISMTAPVIQTPVPSEKISMTAPVMQTPTENNQWVVNFMMPAEYTIETLPIPNNPDITIRETKPYRTVSLRFSGTGKQKKLDKKTAELKAYATANELKLSSGPEFAFYDPPFIPGFARRNEVHFRLAD